MLSSPAERIQSMIQYGGKIEEAQVAKIFDELAPIAPEFMLGDWQGGSFDTGHPSHALLLSSGWAGKSFHTVDNVDPVMVWKNGGRVPNPKVGGARLRQVKFRGVVSAAMVYDKLPIIDSFRYVSDAMVMGAMDSKWDAEKGTYYFYLKRLESKL